MGDPSDAVARYEISTDCSREEFLAVARLYAREVIEQFDLSVDVRRLEWDVSRRAKRRAGAVTHRNGDPESIVLTWGYFEEKGWVRMAETIRHELVHVHLLNERDDPSHGRAFQQLADELDTSVHCEQFTEPNWWVRCIDCDNRLARYRRSKLVRRPEQYQCGGCGGEFVVERTDSR